MRASLHLQSARAMRILLLAGLMAWLTGCASGGGARLQPPAASIQQLTVQTDGEWAVVVRFENMSYDAGMHVYAIDATLDLAGQPAGHLAVSPALDIPAMDADVATAVLRPDAGGAAALAAAKGKAVQYELTGTLSVGKGDKGDAKPFKVHGRGYISPVPGVANVWR